MRFEFRLFQSLCNLTGTSAAALSRYQANFRAIWSLKYPISRFRDFTRTCGKTSVCLVNRHPGYICSAFCVGFGSPLCGFWGGNYRRQIIDILCLWPANDCVMGVKVMVSFVDRSITHHIFPFRWRLNHLQEPVPILSVLRGCSKIHGSMRSPTPIVCNKFLSPCGISMFLFTP